jgi:hypothetical protein
MTPATTSDPGPRAATRAAAAFATLVVVTGLELGVAVGMTGTPAMTRVQVLAVLLAAKVTIVLTALMGWRLQRRTATLTVVAIVMAVVFAVVLMAEAAFHARVR